MPKKWLFLDDTEERHEGIHKIIDAFGLDVEVAHVWTVQEALSCLVAVDGLAYDCVFLDHDLDQTDPEETGYTVANYIAMHLSDEQKPYSVVIHSHNPEGAQRMFDVLTEAGIQTKLVPFGVNGV